LLAGAASAGLFFRRRKQLASWPTAETLTLSQKPLRWVTGCETMW
jgi:hypothetical protein